jgi:hypothetical protein
MRRLSFGEVHISCGKSGFLKLGRFVRRSVTRTANTYKAKLTCNNVAYKINKTKIGNLIKQKIIWKAEIRQIILEKKFVAIS